MIYTKQPIDTEEQLALLESRGLIIVNKEEALAKLCNVGYFRFVSYLHYLEHDHTKHQYKPDSTFEYALQLYLFDKELRKLVFTAIQDIEISLRTKIVQIFSMKYGAFWFMDSRLFKDRNIFDGCLENIKKKVLRSNEDFIKEHKIKYSFPILPPVWKTLEVVSFGTLSKLYCNFSDVIVKKQVAKEFGLPQYLYLESWIRCASVLRNYCAHHVRIWNRRFPLKPQIPDKLPYKWITTQQRPIKLYHQLCCLLYLEQTINPALELKSDLLTLFKQYPNVDFHAMGFPTDWRNEPLWI